MIGASLPPTRLCCNAVRLGGCSVVTAIKSMAVWRRMYDLFNLNLLYDDFSSAHDNAMDESMLKL